MDSSGRNETHDGPMLSAGSLLREEDSFIVVNSVELKKNIDVKRKNEVSSCDFL